MAKKYNLKYELIINDNNMLGFNEGDVETIAEDSKAAGAIDGLFFATMIKRPIDYSSPAYSINMDCQSLSMTAEEEFCLWDNIAQKLLVNPNLPDFMKEICENAVKQFHEIEKENINRSTTND